MITGSLSCFALGHNQTTVIVKFSPSQDGYCEKNTVRWSGCTTIGSGSKIDWWTCIEEIWGILPRNTSGNQQITKCPLHINITWLLLCRQTDGITGVKLSALDLRMLIIQCAKALQLQFDIKEGDVVGICCENSLEFVVVTFATLCLGATAAPFDVSYTTHEIQHALDLSQPKVLFISSLVCDKILKILPEQRYLEMVVTLDEPKHPEGSPKMCLFNDLLQKIPVSTSEKKNVQCTLCTYKLLHFSILLTFRSITAAILNVPPLMRARLLSFYFLLVQPARRKLWNWLNPIYLQQYINLSKFFQKLLKKI